jgi:hypothetical protein
MPTAAKLFSAVAFAIAAYVAADVYKLGVPDRTVWGAFNLISAAIGMLCGWLVMGGLAGRGYRAAIGYGLRTMVTVVFWILLAFSTYMMIMRSMNKVYDGPMEALVGIFDLMIENAAPMANTTMIGTLFAGGIVSGMIVEWVGRRWR